MQGALKLPRDQPTVPATQGDQRAKISSWPWAPYSLREATSASQPTPPLHDQPLPKTLRSLIQFAMGEEESFE